MGHPSVLWCGMKSDSRSHGHHKFWGVPLNGSSCPESRERPAVSLGLESFFPLFPALKCWANLVRPFGAGFGSCPNRIFIWLFPAWLKPCPDTSPSQPGYRTTSRNLDPTFMQSNA
jgi:hypothetical protein